MEFSRWKNLLFKLKSKLCVWRRRKKRNLPPGPFPLPIIGNLHLLDATKPHQSLHSLSLKHGPLMSLHMGSSSIVVGSSSDLARHFLTLDDHSFASRPSTLSGELLNYNRTDIGWAPYGAYWLQARKICARHLLSGPRLASFAHARAHEARALARGLFVATSNVDVRAHVWSSALNMQCRMVFGRTREDVEFKEMMAEFFHLSGLNDIGEAIPWLKFLDLQGNVRKMKKVAKKCDAFWEEVVKEHEKRRMVAGDSYAAEDLVDVLLQLSENSNLEVKLERTSVKAFAQDMISAGVGSCAGTVEWALSELLRHRQVLERGNEELDSVVGTTRWVEEGDIPRLPYIGSVVKEAMRLHPIAPLLIPHLSREHRNVAGYGIPAGTKILVNVYSIMRDPSVWEDPLEFRPERFLDRRIEVTGEDHRLLPFGTGSRMCPGQVLGLRMVQLILATLLQGFRWRLPEGTKVEDMNMEEVFGLATTRKVPLEAVAESRLSAELYADT